jgi:hypothetical protein
MDENKSNETNESKILNFIKNKLKNLKKQNKSQENNEPDISDKLIDDELIELLSNILDNNPDFFILVENILLDLVKDNELNFTIFNYGYIIESITKISVIYNNLKLDDLQPLFKNKNYFLKIIKWTFETVIKNNSDKIINSDIIINKFNDLINNYTELINLFRN